MSKEQTDLLPCPLCNVALTRDGKSPLGDIWSHPLNGCAMQVSWFTATPEWVEKWNRRASPSPAGGVQGVGDADHLVFRREALRLAATLDPAVFAGDFDAVNHDTVDGVARTISMVLGGYDFTLDDNGRLFALVAGDHGYGATGIIIDAALSSQAQTTGGVE